MSSNRRASRPGDAWCWRRWITATQQEAWVARLQVLGCPTWTVTEKPDRIRLLLAVYFPTQAEALRLARQLGGKPQLVRAEQWIATNPSPPLEIGKALRIVHEKASGRKDRTMPQLHIPHGLAFGSGEHATTAMLLRALTEREGLAKSAVLDLGTGSGVLALAARLFGAHRIVATDFDAEAIRTARQNEALNFREPLVRWQQADVKKFRVKARYDLVLANLFSGILCEAAEPIATSLRAGGELWLSGILRAQQDEVIAAYLARNLTLLRTVRRGKWVMLRFGL